MSPSQVFMLLSLAGGLVLSEPMPDAAPVGGLAMPEEPELLPDGVLVSAGGVDGMVEGLVDGVVEGVMGAGVVVSSIFLPQAPRASKAESAKTVAAGLKWIEFIRISFLSGWKNLRAIFTLPKRPIHADETQAYCLVGIYRRNRP